MIYAIVPFRLKNERSLQERIEGLADAISIYKGEAPKAYFVSYNGTTRELADEIGYNDANNVEIGTGIVIPVTSHAGYAIKDLWEWIRLYG